MGSSKWGVLFGLLILHVIGYLIFLKGFFPSKVVVPGFNEFHTGQSPFMEHNEAKFDKLILMVVDAMRSDFLYSDHSHMKFVHQLINENCAVPFTSYSNPPTVTLPRLKGITTGGTPSFLDAILNIADDKDDSQSLSNQDSWLHQFQNNLNVINFFGDDTWLKLFPPEKFFNQYEGTNSFFVNDFTDVDNNVTRHLNDDLFNSKWDALILHYLGLDHIGHKGGPNSIFMRAKQEEMDGIIEKLYQETIDSNTLLVVMGDHGMNEIGNHGGSSMGETNPGLLFASPKFKMLKKNLKCPLAYNNDYKYYNYINQIDLVPTLAALLNFPIPKNNLGIIIKDILGLWKPEAQKSILMENSEQFMNIYEAKYANDTDIINEWKTSQNSGSIEVHYDFLSKIQGLLTSAATEYKYVDIYIGLSILVATAIVAFVLFNWYFLVQATINPKYNWYFIGISIFYSIHFHASSLIEEEYQIWWFFSIICLFALYFNNHLKSLKYFWLILVGLRIIRSWSITGQKFTTPYTFSSYLLQNVDILWVLNIATYFLTAILIYSQGSLIDCVTLREYETLRENVKDFGSLVTFIVTFVTCSISFLFKLCQYFNDGKRVPDWLLVFLHWTCESYGITIDPKEKNQLHELNIHLSKILFYCMGVLLIVRIVLGKVRKLHYGLLTDLTNVLTLLLIHQSRPEIVPIFLIFYLVKFLAAKLLANNEIVLRKNIDQLMIIITLFSLCMQNLSFFSMGNTNLLATVDLSNSYNGFKSYDVFLVGFLTYVSNFAGPIFWSLASLQLIFENNVVCFDTKKSSKDLVNLKFLKYQILYVKSLGGFLFYSIAGLSLVASCFNLRFHLFIWSVFSPKLLFFASWTLLTNILIDTISALGILALC